MERFDLEIQSLDGLLDIDFCELGIKGLIFDYGGTIDTNGEHWSEVILKGYRDAGLGIPYEKFWEAYVYAEKELAKRPHIVSTDTFHELLQKKIAIEFDALDLKLPDTEVDNYQTVIVNSLYDMARLCVCNAKSVLEVLAAKFPLVMVSNFYGNLNAVLEDFGIRHYFKTIIESAVVGVRKPDPEIFCLGIQDLKLEPNQIAVIGDSIQKDIIPARSLSLNTIHFRP